MPAENSFTQKDFKENNTKTVAWNLSSFSTNRLKDTFGSENSQSMSQSIHRYSVTRYIMFDAATLLAVQFQRGSQTSRYCVDELMLSVLLSRFLHVLVPYYERFLQLLSDKQIPSFILASVTFLPINSYSFSKKAVLRL